jgi:hypothetical protein
MKRVIYVPSELDVERGEQISRSLNLPIQIGDSLNTENMDFNRKEIQIRRTRKAVALNDSQTTAMNFTSYDTTIVMPDNFEELLGAKSDLPFFASRVMFKIGKVMGGSNAEKAG